MNIPSTIYSGENFTITARLNSDRNSTFQLWTYLYRGSHCYSCNNNTKEPEEHALTINVTVDSSEIIAIPIQPDILQEGNYKLKLKAQRDDRKTLFEVTSDIQVVGKQSSILLSADQKIKQQFGGEGFIMYETNSYKSKRLIPYFIAIALCFLCLALLFTKKE